MLHVVGIALSEPLRDGEAFLIIIERLVAPTHGRQHAA
jgi:hypothetical protein